MPFVKKTDSQDFQPPTDIRKIFIGREGELLFFVQNILKPKDPTHNIISISGQGGVGKSTLLARYVDETHAPEFKDYCLTAAVDERQTTPASIMEKFADQLHMTGEFEKALKQYKEVLRKLQNERQATREALLRKTTADIAGSVVKDVPVVGGILKEGVEAATGYLFEELHYRELLKDAERLEDPIRDLTRAFVAELNRFTEIQVTIGSTRTKHRQRVILFFDTFERLAAEAAPWLLDYFLEANISNNVVLVVAGRDPIEQSTPDDPKRWLPYLDNHIIYSISLDSFTLDETRAYLDERGITNAEQIERIWQLSQGLPLYLGFLTSNPQGKVDPTTNVVANFLRWIPEQERIKRRLALDAALFSRPFNQDELEAFTYISEDERLALYHWLIGQPFVRSQEGRYRYHELAQNLFSRHLYQRSEKEYYASRRALANHYKRLIEEMQEKGGKEVYHLAEWMGLSLALVYQLLLLPDEASHIKAIKHVLKAYEETDKEQDEEISKLLRELSNYQANATTRLIAWQLLQYKEADWGSQESLVATSYLLEKVEHKSSFPAELLSHIYRSRGITYRFLAENSKALADFTHAVELDATDAQVYAQRGLTYTNLRKYQQAIEEFDHALELDHNAVLVYLNQSIAYRELKNYQRAMYACERAIELLTPKGTWVEAYAYTHRAITYEGLKEYELAFADFDRALELDPSYAWVYGQRSITHRELKNYQQAILEINRALELTPENPWIYLQRSITHRELKNYQQALLDCECAINLDSNDARTYFQRGEIHLHMKNIGQATADHARSWELDPRDNRYGWITEWAKMCRERPDPEMTERLERIAATDPVQYAAYVCRGVVMWLHDYFEKAMVELEQAIQQAPEEWDPYFWKGMICASLGRDEEAMAALEKALEKDLPPVLLTPLRWLEQDRPDFYQKFVVPLFARYELTG